MVKRADIILIVALTLIAAALFFVQYNGNDLAREAVIYFEDDSIMQLSLDGTTEWTWRDGESFVTVSVEDKAARVSASSCPDQVCVRQGSIHRPGQSIVCLPNRISVQLSGTSDLDATLY